MSPVAFGPIGFLVAFAVSACAAWPVYRLLLAIRSRQTVSEYLGDTHQAKQGTPTMGGLIILIGLVAVMAFFREAYAELFLVLAFALIGFLDDFAVPRLMPGKRGLGWIPKLALELAVAVAYAVLTEPEYPWMRDNPTAYCWTVLIVLFASNAYNFADGLDGLAGGLAVIIAGAIGLMTGLGFESQFPFAGMAGALIGGTAAFLFLNAPPARVFMGDVGALPIGALLGAMMAHMAQMAMQHGAIGAVPHSDGLAYQLGIRSGAMGVAAMVLALVFLGFVLIAELVPVPLQILSVKLRKGKRLFPRTPIHHAFEHKGWPESRITWTFLLVQLVVAGVAIVLWAGGVAP